MKKKTKKVETMPIMLWLATIEDKTVRDKALLNAEKAVSSGQTNSLGLRDYSKETTHLSFAIGLGFTWGLTPEGIKYWWNEYFKVFQITRSSS